MVEAIHDLDPDNPHIRPNTTPWHGENEPNPLELLARASINNTLQPFRLAEVLARSVPAMGRLSQSVAQRQFSATKPVPPTRFNGTVTAHRVVEGRSFDLKEVRAIKSSVPQATINDVVLTVCGGALREYLQAQNELPHEPGNGEPHQSGVQLRDHQRARTAGAVVLRRREAGRALWTRPAVRRHESDLSGTELLRSDYDFRDVVSRDVGGPGVFRRLYSEQLRRSQSGYARQDVARRRRGLR